MTDRDLLKDEEFIEIQNLNSIESDKRRHSIAYDKVMSTQDNEDNKDHVHVNSEDHNDLKHIISHQTEEDSKLLHNDEFLKRYLKNLHIAEKRRYRNESIISFFSDVDFDNRPSIFDGAINEPYLSSFEGPVLEKQIKAFEKSKKEMKREISLEKQLGINPEKQDNGLDSRSAVTSTVDLDTPMMSTSVSTSDLVRNSSTFNYKRVPTKYILNFSGLYVMFWMILGLIIVKGLIDYKTEYGDFRNFEILNIFITKKMAVAKVDFAMYVASYGVVFIQWLVKKNLIQWKSTGIWIATIYEFGFMIFFYYATLCLVDLHWISRIYLFLHSVVYLMKMHSYSFFNGYLWCITRELAYSTKALAKYKDTAGKNIIKVLERSRDFCQFELNTQTVSNDSNMKFPDNITIPNYFMFTMFPAVVYQFEYPRTQRIRWGYVFEKVCAIFGTIFILIVVAQLFMLPPLERALKFRDHPLENRTVRTMEWFYLVAEIDPGLTVIYMLCFYLIWDAILNCFAELTRFADRYFYGDWWNCVSWSEFARIWNVPVHKFLVRHVYHASMNNWKLTKVQATLFTFVLSSIFHELAMIIIWKRLRGYLFLFQLSQLPMAYVSSTILKDKAVFNNVLFWCGVCSGPAVIIALYTMF
ncbi:similar to Saccharomyces cerevisiae YCR048W ARE1 Acyl-CoA:sterol acyltransferase, isozyme of Are2p [Maudiozyma barnettii]|uniref:O-acyltransferase n=1 Tax=Maudiozyma barnettii TaxID=61262 RepID=A0A8H2VBM1_9SACH|nr:sterol acyltransferase [Kazachstania barnettii]CAB4252278.1 similar to Saccharomyces cerevisiae YCR048W ARE1 Acyl-CoA:sterol acyltransferase, isozyme of Are2p [Kazachstania barnettii]CAD1778975.1 similar to Saccharomyces cerevisiae YCR048W ARE1 Acyl-CoA:sterol acyltransferase, isozyme of Are2p [Kazachstania barnettii]